MRLATNLVGYQDLPCVESADHCLAGSGHEALDCGSLGSCEANASSLVDKVTFWGGFCCGAIIPGSSTGWLVGQYWHSWLKVLRCPKAGVDLLMNWAGSWFGWLRRPRYLRADVGLLVSFGSGITGWYQYASGKSQGLGFPSASVISLMFGTGSWGPWLQGPRCFKTDVSHLVGWVGSRGCWMRSPRCPSTRNGLLLFRAKNWGVLGMVTVCWWVGSESRCLPTGE